MVISQKRDAAKDLADEIREEIEIRKSVNIGMRKFACGYAG
jgi:hypothetical protein